MKRQLLAAAAEGAGRQPYESPELNVTVFRPGHIICTSQPLSGSNEALEDGGDIDNIF